MNLFICIVIKMQILSCWNLRSPFSVTFSVGAFFLADTAFSTNLLTDWNERPGHEEMSLFIDKLHSCTINFSIIVFLKRVRDLINFYISTI